MIASFNSEDVMIATVMSMDSKILLLLWRYCFLSLRLSKRINWYFWGILSEASNIFGSGIMLEPSNCTLKKKSSRPQSFTGLSKLKIVCLIRHYVRVVSVLKKKPIKENNVTRIVQKKPGFLADIDIIGMFFFIGSICKNVTKKIGQTVTICA